MFVKLEKAKKEPCDYMKSVPETDEHVAYTLYTAYPKIMNESLWGLYSIDRLQGLNVFEAWKNTLLYLVSCREKGEADDCAIVSANAERE